MLAGWLTMLDQCRVAPQVKGARPIPTNVLMVDDDADLRRLVTTWLQTAPGCVDDGWRVTSAATVAEACELLQTCAFDCVLLDLGFESLSPQQVFDSVRQCARNVPILIYSNSPSDELRDYCVAHGAHKFIPKLSIGGCGLGHEICEAMDWHDMEREAERLNANAAVYRETAANCRVGV